MTNRELIIKLQAERILHRLRSMKFVTESKSNRPISVPNLMEMLTDFVAVDLDWLLDRVAEIYEALEEESNG